MPRYEDYNALDFASDERFIRFHDKSDDREVAFWQQWIAMHPHKQKEIQEATLLLDVLALHLTAEEETQERNRFLRQIDLDKTLAPPYRARISTNRWAYAAAAILLLVMGIGIFIYRYTGETPAVTSGATWITYSTPAAKQSKITMADGTRVHLGTKSVLQYTEHFSEDRVVKLKGKALFDVEKAKELPFRVETDDFTIQVLGTTFCVEIYDEDDMANINLLQGKIRIDDKQGGQTLLRPGQGLLIDRATGNKEIRKMDSRQAMAWTNGVMQFHQADLNQIGRVIQREYGYTVETRGGQQIRFTGQIEHLPLSDMLDMLGATLNIQYQLKDNHVYIQARP